MRVCCFVECERPPTRSMTSKFSLDNFVAATHVALCAPDSRRPHRSNHCRRQNLEPGVCTDFIDSPDASDAQSLLPNRDGPLPHRARSITATNSDVEIFLDDFVAPVQGSAWRAWFVTTVLTKYGRRTTSALDQPGAPWILDLDPGSAEEAPSALPGGECQA